MADFTSAFWSWFIIVATVLGLIGCFVLLVSQTTKKNDPDRKAETMGHVWDETLEELNNPLPFWWLLLFYGLIAFSVIYLILYPGLGSFSGVLGWSQQGRYEAEQKAAEERYGPIFNRYANQALADVARDPTALGIGERLFANYCAQCHGSDARGARGYPNLRDDDWLYGGEPEMIKKVILEGRQGNMPPWEEILGKEGVFDVAEYVRTLGGYEADSTVVSRGREIYAQNCAVCHNADGSGNHLFGAPDLTDEIWLYGGSQKRIIESIANGRFGKMPANGEFLGEARVHLLAAYVYSLSNAE